MKLRFSPTSPYVRKVTVTAIETGLDGRIERVPTNVWDPDTDIATDNPLGKVPALITDDGAALYDSPVICEYLDSLHDGARLIPASGSERWRALTLQALGDGCLDAGIARLLESRRPEAERSAGWVARQVTVMGRGLDSLDGMADGWGDTVTIGQIAVGCALGWFDLRFGDDNWRATRPALADWFEGFSERPSMTATFPKEPA